MMQSTKLRVWVAPHRGVICAYFPDQRFDGKLFHGLDVASVTAFMYARRLRKALWRDPLKQGA